MWSFVLFLLVIPFVVFGVNAILNRLPGAHPHKTPFTAGFYANLLCLPAFVLFYFLTFETAILPLLCGTILVAIYLNCVVFLNWFFFTLTDVSMHIQLMFQLYHRGPTPPAQLVERYNKNTILGNRVPRLLELGQLRLENGRLFVKGQSVLLAASIIVVIRKLLGIPAHPEDVDHTE